MNPQLDAASREASGFQDTAPSAAPSAPSATPTARRPARRHRGRLVFESVLIVLSVLLGLAPGEAREGLREREVARAALINFRREIESNLAQLERRQPRHEMMAARLEQAAATSTPGTAFDAFLAVMPKGGAGTEPLRDVAWETAESTGALRLLDYETAALLSEIYVVQRAGLLPTVQRLADRFSDPRNFDPTQRAAMTRTHRMLLVELSGQAAYLIGIYRRALRQLRAPQGFSVRCS